MAAGFPQQLGATAAEGARAPRGFFVPGAKDAGKGLEVPELVESKLHFEGSFATATLQSAG